MKVLECFAVRDECAKVMGTPWGVLRPGIFLLGRDGDPLGRGLSGVLATSL